jgi:hypothetical protein
MGIIAGDFILFFLNHIGKLHSTYAIFELAAKALVSSQQSLSRWKINSWVIEILVQLP